MKRLFTLLLALCIALPLTETTAGADRSAVRVVLDGVPLELSSDAYISDGSTMVPLRALAEELGYTVTWVPQTRTAILTSPGKTPAPLAGTIVVLDPGHGGASSGAFFSGIAEKDLDLAIARKTASILEAAGAQVILTRTGDEDVGLYDRTDLAAEHGADLFVSIHCNASDTALTATGIYTAAAARDTESWVLAEILRASMMASSGAGDMGTEERPHLAVLRTAQMPAALVECGFMSTPAELEKLTDPDYQALLAQGIADGITAFLARGT